MTNESMTIPRNWNIVVGTCLLLARCCCVLRKIQKAETPNSECSAGISVFPGHSSVHIIYSEIGIKIIDRILRDDVRQTDDTDMLLYGEESGKVFDNLRAVDSRRRPGGLSSAEHFDAEGHDIDEAING